jgi:glutathione S-transferase
MQLHYNPISSYSQKVLIALYEKNIPFTPMIVNLMDPASRADYEKVYPIGKVPCLVEDQGRVLPESTAIVEYLDNKFPNNPPRIIPQNSDAAIEARRWTCFADSYLNDSMQKILFDGMRPADKRDGMGVEAAQKLLGRAYAMLDRHLDGKKFIVGDTLSIADCAAAPSLFYLRKVMPFESHRNIASYFGRMLDRPSYARAIKEAEPILKSMGLA